MNRVKGDLLGLARDGKFDVVVQGCNCYCAFGAGLAKQIKTQYPEAYAADLETIRGDASKIGSYTQAKTYDGFIIINAYTQVGTNSFGEMQDLFEYDGFEVILANLVEEFGGVKFGFPYIGMGLAGGSKDRIISLLEDFSQKVEDRDGTVTLVEYCGF